MSVNDFRHTLCAFICLVSICIAFTVSTSIIGQKYYDYENTYKTFDCVILNATLISRQPCLYKSGDCTCKSKCDHPLSCNDEFFRN